MHAATATAALLLSSAPFMVQAKSWPWSASANDGAGSAQAAPVAETIVQETIPVIHTVVAPVSSSSAIDESHLFRLGAIKIDPAEFKMEAYLSLVILLYLVVAFWGRRANKVTANKWFKANAAVLRDEFAGLGLSDQVYLLDGGNEAKSYATGRRAIEHAWIRIKFPPRHDPLLYFAELVRSLFDTAYDPQQNVVQIEFKLEPSQKNPANKFCFAVVDKKALRKTRDRWDMATFTNLTEHSGADSSLIVMTESGDIVSQLFKPYLLDAFKPGSDFLDQFESLIISDAPILEPNEKTTSLPEDFHRILLTLRLPSSRSEEELQKVATPLISLICNFADVLSQKSPILPDTALNKFKRNRTEVSAKLKANAQKALLEETKDQREDLAARKRKLEKERAEAKLASMSKSERVKALAKQEAANRKQTEMKMARAASKKK